MKTDLALRGEVLDELEWEPGVNATRIGVAVEGGVVTLTGEVDSYTERVEAERATFRVAGVKGVASELQVRLPGAAERSDADIARVAADALEWNGSIPRDRIRILVKKAWVTLEGRWTGHTRGRRLRTPCVVSPGSSGSATSSRSRRE